jgi:putative 4-mercaptohistidine N1-methyltranferase
MKRNIYETDKLLAEYLLFHYQNERVLFPSFLRNQLKFKRFSSLCVDLCKRSLKMKIPRALDLGCAVGGASFELSRFCSEVIAIDFSEKFIRTAQQLQKKKTIECEMPIEGDLKNIVKFSLPKNVKPERISFRKGDAQNLNPNLGTFDLVLMANLIDRLPDPSKCLRSIPNFINSKGILVITSPYTWLEEFTPKRKWLGGFKNRNKNIYTSDSLRKILNPHFSFLEKRDLPFLIREHARKYQLGIAEATIWKRRL